MRTARQGGPAGGLLALSEEFLRRGLRTELVTGGLDRDPSPAVAAALMVATREALTNVAKHAATGRAVVRAVSRPDGGGDRGRRPRLPGQAGRGGRDRRGDPRRRRGRTHVSATLASYLLQVPIRITDREREILGLVAGGETDQDIAELLQLSVRTDHCHLDRIRNKTGSRRRADLTRFALERGIVHRSPKEG